MASNHLEKTYHCWNDCLMSGCPGHTATLDLQSVSNAWHLNDGQGHDFYPDDGALHAFFEMFGEMANFRVEAQGLIDDMNKAKESYYKD